MRIYSVCTYNTIFFVYYIEKVKRGCNPRQVQNYSETAVYIHIYRAYHRDKATLKYPPRLLTYRARSAGRAPSLPSPFLDLDFASSYIVLVGLSVDSGVCLVSIQFVASPLPTRYCE